MFSNFTRSVVVLATLGMSTAAYAQFLEPAARAFSFQARLNGPGIPQNGVVDLEISIYDAVGGGNVVSGPHALPGQPISGGVVSAAIPDIDSAAFDGRPRWLGVRVNGGAELSPRVPLIAVPYALRVDRVGSTELDDDVVLGDAVTSGSLQVNDSEGAAAIVILGDPGAGGSQVAVAGQVRMDGFRLTAAAAQGRVLTSDADGVGTWQALPAPQGGWSTTGNAGTDPSVNFLGTTDDVALELRVNDVRGLRLEPGANNITPNLIGGHNSNSVTLGYGGTIGGGGAPGAPNRVTDIAGTVAGGVGNQAGDGDGVANNVRFATVGGGVSNTARGEAATVGGGQTNTAAGGSSTVAGGFGNDAGAAYAAIAGGGRTDPNDPSTGNRVTDDYGTIGGGGNNQAGSADGDPTNSAYATIGGGVNNLAGRYATVGGGAGNSATGIDAVVGGGERNWAAFQDATIGGGYSNYASSAGTVAGGTDNDAGPASAVGGGGGNSASGRNSTIGGGEYNDAAAEFATIAGGGPVIPFDPTTSNRVTDEYGSIGGGGGNQAGNDSGTPEDASFATVGGGNTNTAAGGSSTVGGGQTNTAGGGSSTVAGGASNSANGGSSSIGGGFSNTTDGIGARIGGGRNNTASNENATIAGGRDNDAAGLNSAVGGGASNTADGVQSVVAGGFNNSASGLSSRVGGGGNNAASANYASISGGSQNNADGQYAAIGGGLGNAASADHTAVAGGQRNTAGGGWSFVGGGRDNQATGTSAAIAGGTLNTASGTYASVPGGDNNRAAGANSLAAGHFAQADHDGTFVWADSFGLPFTSTGQDQFLIRASGGTGIGTNSPTNGLLHVSNNIPNRAAIFAEKTFGVGPAIVGEGEWGIEGRGTIAVFGRADTANDVGLWSSADAHVQGDLTVFGSKQGYVVDWVLNVDDEPLECGDVVEIVGHAEPLAGDIPVIVVRKARSANSRAVLGPMDCALEQVTFESRPAGPQAEARVLTHWRRRAGAVAVNEIGQVVTLGSFRTVKVDASFGTIRPGDLLVSSPTAGHAMRHDDPKVGTVIGKALSSLADGRGVIPIMVTPR
ncbi:MAG: hypothetical protein O7F76_10685 [Planctomycetota bacterium]|nr:hypothetical protein [Planctomycetota bacterium]